MVSKKRATTNNNSNNNTKCKRNLGNCIHRGMQLLHDGTPTHWERSTTAYLNANNVYVVDFSPKSQDLNIIENIWDELNQNRTEQENSSYSDNTESIESKTSLR